MENKPFIFGVATSGDNFTDREKETERLLLNFRHGVNTILISPRRWGKTSLVQKVCRLAQSDNLKVVYLDIFSCRSDKDFYDAFAAAVLKQTSSKLDEWLENVKLFLSRISPKISMGTDPMTDFSISLEMNPKSNDVDEILQLPEKSRRRKAATSLCVSTSSSRLPSSRIPRHFKNGCALCGNCKNRYPIVCSAARSI